MVWSDGYLQTLCQLLPVLMILEFLLLIIAFK